MTALLIFAGKIIIVGLVIPFFTGLIIGAARKASRQLDDMGF